MKTPIEDEARMEAQKDLNNVLLAVELEREECAKIADYLSDLVVREDSEWTALGIIEECGYMIRKRGTKPI